jgi:toxin ParE1/3/4
MAHYLESPLAQQDLAEIIEIIAADNPPAARSFLLEITRQYQLLAENPQMGRERLDLGQRLRSFALGSYIIIYQTIPDGVAIARFLHGARDIEKLL